MSPFILVVVLAPHDIKRLGVTLRSTSDQQYGRAKTIVVPDSTDTRADTVLADHESVVSHVVYVSALTTAKSMKWGIAGRHRPDHERAFAREPDDALGLGVSDGYFRGRTSTEPGDRKLSTAGRKQGVH